jgi:hypothetical protein
LPGLFDELCLRFSSDDEVTLFTDLRDSLQIAQRYFGLEEQQEFSALCAQLDAHIEDLEANRPSSGSSSNSNPYLLDELGCASLATAATIFYDVDD